MDRKIFTLVNSGRNTVRPIHSLPFWLLTGQRGGLVIVEKKDEIEFVYKLKKVAENLRY